MNTTFQSLSMQECMEINGGAGSLSNLIPQLVTDLSTTVNDALSNLGLGSLGLGGLSGGSGGLSGILSELTSGLG
jgi:predicted transporter